MRPASGEDGADFAQPVLLQVVTSATGNEPPVAAVLPDDDSDQWHRRVWLIESSSGDTLPPRVDQAAWSPVTGGCPKPGGPPIAANLSRAPAPLPARRARRSSPPSIHQPSGGIDVWVPETLRTLCDVLILVDQSAEPVVSLDVVERGWGVAGEGSQGSGWPRVRCGRCRL
jgi:hypothetical protein